MGRNIGHADVYERRTDIQRLLEFDDVTAMSTSQPMSSRVRVSCSVLTPDQESAPNPKRLLHSPVLTWRCNPVSQNASQYFSARPNGSSSSAKEAGHCRGRRKWLRINPYIWKRSGLQYGSPCEKARERKPQQSVTRKWLALKLLASKLRGSSRTSWMC